MVRKTCVKKKNSREIDQNYTLSNGKEAIVISLIY